MAEDVGAQIRRVRIERGMSLTDVSREAGLAKSNLFNIEMGETSPMVSTLRKIAKALGVHPRELL